MKNFKEIAEKCLRGELSGRFKNRKGENIPSEALGRSSNNTYPYTYCHSHGVTIHGDYYKSGKFSEYDIIDFIPNNMQEQIKIDIPEGKIPVIEQTENGVTITWKEKELTYDIIESKLNCCISSFKFLPSLTSIPFYKKVEVLRKLTNIRNYFGKPEKYDRGYCIEYSRHQDCLYVGNVNTIGVWIFDVLFKEKEHAEQAIKILGDELKYLFEPW